MTTVYAFIFMFLIGFGCTGILSVCVKDYINLYGDTFFVSTHYKLEYLNKKLIILSSFYLATILLVLALIFPFVRAIVDTLGILFFYVLTCMFMEKVM